MDQRTTSVGRFVPAPARRGAAPVHRGRSGKVDFVLVGRGERRGREVAPDTLFQEVGASGIEALGDVFGAWGMEVSRAGSGEVTLVQCPLGQRPLYWTGESRDAGEPAWGTELAGLLPRLGRRMFDDAALREMLVYRWCAGARTLVQGIGQLLPGTALTRRSGGSQSASVVHDPRYEPGSEETVEGLADELVAALEASLDVALSGAARPAILLSGGVDSALLAALAQRIRPDLLAVTPTWPPELWDDPELPRARQASEHLGIEHRILELSGDEVLAAASDVTRLLEAPPKDHWFLAVVATLHRLRDDADVVVHGAAADMLLGGRSRMRIARALRRARWQRWVPGAVRRALAAPLPLDRSHLGDLRAMLLEDPVRGLFQMGRVELDRGLYHRYRHVFGDGEPAPELEERFRSPDGDVYESRLRMSLYTWARMHTQEVTRAADDVGLRPVFPFVDPAVLELAFRLPPHRVYDDEGVRKPVVRAAHARFYPRDWGHWPKLGFPTPTVEWHRGCLAGWLEERLGPDSVGRRLFGSGLDEFQVERDLEHRLALACLEDFSRRFGVSLAE